MPPDCGGSLRYSADLAAGDAIGRMRSAEGGDAFADAGAGASRVAGRQIDPAGA